MKGRIPVLPLDATLRLAGFRHCSLQSNKFVYGNLL